jgi:hypothetical protein
LGLRPFVVPFRNNKVVVAAVEASISRASSP